MTSNATQETASSIERNLRRMLAQETLFAAHPGWADLLRVTLEGSEAVPAKVNVWRNHAIEPVVRLAQPYLDWGDIRLDFTYSAYDDTLTFFERREANLELLWLDCKRLPKEPGWLQSRVDALRDLSRAPILLITTDHVDVTGIDVHVADVTTVCHSTPLLDPRAMKISGSPISPQAMPLIARSLACRWLPALLHRPIKCVAVDLDHTLYAGALGEEGPLEVLLTPGHAALQRMLKDLRTRGVFLALASRNEHIDVQTLFEVRTDFPLRWEDFSVTEISWSDKADSLARIARMLNIDTSACVFLDDNLGELAHVGMRIPEVRTVWAQPDSELTARALENTPGLWQWHVSKEDSKRIADQKANARRTELAASAPQSYLRSLGARLRFSINDASLLHRMAEMSKKTNQFNLALARLTVSDYAERLRSPAHAVVTVELADRFGDSGTIGLIAAHLTEDTVEVEELLISCRALGRQLEDAIIIGALRCLPALPVRFIVQVGPRNQPAREWLGCNRVWPTAKVSDFPMPTGILIERGL